MNMTPRQAVAFVRHHGVVLEAARGLEPSLAPRVAGGPISGSWWGHPLGHEIYALTLAMQDSSAILVCTLAHKRLTYIHRRLWPAFVRMAARFPPHCLDKVTEIHLPNGRHKRADIRFPEWVPDAVMAAAQLLCVADATDPIKTWLERYGNA